MSTKKRLKKGDEVIVIAGRDKGKKGEILRMKLRDDRAVVQGVNVVKRHTRASQAGPGGIVEKEAAIHISNIAMVDPKTGEATRVGYRWLEDGRKVRFAKRSGEIIDR